MVRTRKIGGLLGAVALLVSLLVGIPATAVGATHLAGARIFVSSSSSGTVDGIPFTSGDILVYDSSADTWAMAFDLSLIHI